MGRSKKLRKQLIGKPCIFCLGARWATTVEHIPPRAFFLNKLRPKGYEFPACEKCNNGASQQDQVACMFASVAADTAKGGIFTEQSIRLMKGVANNSPEVIRYIFAEQSEARLVDGDEMFFVPVDRRVFHYWLNPWAAKQATALWWFHTKQIAGPDLRVLVQWITNADLLENGVPDNLFNLLGQGASLTSGRKDFSDQFFYRYGIDDCNSFGAFLMVFHQTSAVLVSIVPKEFLESSIRVFGFGEQFRVTSSGLQRSLD